MTRKERTIKRNETIIADIEKIMSTMPGKFFAKLDIACNMLETKHFISAARIKKIYMQKIKS